MEKNVCDIKHFLHILKSFSFQSKNLFSAFRTPAVLFVLVCLLYVLSAVLFFVGLGSVSFACDCMLCLAMIAMLTWAFIRYSGKYREVGTAIDKTTGVMLDQVRNFLIIV